MTKITLTIAATFLAIATAMPAQAGGYGNGKELNGRELNGKELNGYATQGTELNGQFENGQLPNGQVENGAAAGIAPSFTLRGVILPPAR